jgi:hypothetical protein
MLTESFTTCTMHAGCSLNLEKKGRRREYVSYSYMVSRQWRDGFAAEINDTGDWLLKLMTALLGSNSRSRLDNRCKNVTQVHAY